MIVRALNYDWMEPYANAPSWRVLCDQFPQKTDMVFDKYGDGMYVAEQDGYVRFYHYLRPGPGFGGRTFNIKVRDPEHPSVFHPKDLVGPWSSRAAVVTQVSPVNAVDVSLTDSDDTWERGYTYYASAITMELVLSHLFSEHRVCPTELGACLVLHSNSGREYNLLPTRNGECKHEDRYAAVQHLTATNWQEHLERWREEYSQVGLLEPTMSGDQAGVLR